MLAPLFNFLRMFRSISAADEALIGTELRPRAAAPGEYLHQEGRVCRELFFVVEGVLRIVKQNEQGVEVTHFFLKENQFCTILHSFTQETPSTEGIQAACPAQVIGLPKQGLERLYAQLPYLRELLNGIIQQALLDKIQTRNAYLGADAKTRYQLFLIRQPEVALRVPLRDVASYLGVTQQSLSRIRRTAN
ncbi:Crp/Fnr family transcriptional regulator [Hymenobacter sp. CRA2]|uniref:Crp/Fnr family transcriptional regulator n=1 Tax=Hymenobacter sp. CRA2 TaxID=1955620 RepID=UPI00098FE876|nr:Crp/Fnr family transcriptional regulator [Hymenobacter sp. CRA2]OON68187.1 Crp/Fnr family transcriptional regulator [Hymenobacter sp. CRA2]